MTAWSVGGHTDRTSETVKPAAVRTRVAHTRASGGGTSRDLQPPGWPEKYAALQAGWNDAAGAGHGREVGTTRMASYERSYAGGLVVRKKQQSDPLPRAVVSASFASSRSSSLSHVWLARAVACWSLAGSLVWQPPWMDGLATCVVGYWPNALGNTGSRAPFSNCAWYRNFGQLRVERRRAPTRC